FTELIDFLNSKNIYIIEDCSHAIGSKINGYSVGRVGHFCFASLAFTKPMHTFNGGFLAGGRRGDSTTSKFYTTAEQLYKNMPAENLFISLSHILKGILFFLLTRKSVYGLLVYPIITRLRGPSFNFLGIYNFIFKRSKNRPSFKFKLATLSNLKAYLGIELYKMFQKNLSLQIRNAAIIDEIFAAEKLNLNIPNHPGNNGNITKSTLLHNRYFYALTLPSHGKSQLKNKLQDSGIDVGEYIMRHCPREIAKFYSTINRSSSISRSSSIEGRMPLNWASSFPVTDYTYENILQIPIDSSVTPSKAAFIAKVISQNLILVIGK
ncbi:MAG: DegT/DnrJ/EryC1/StrS family aminotransferase, partial [Oligoflexia bacterium]|nr:DegT/DnrJ/EryC1/StrS family aminotransferase [Oligoflexia bacterium]